MIKIQFPQSNFIYSSFTFKSIKKNSTKNNALSLSFKYFKVLISYPDYLNKKNEIITYSLNNLIPFGSKITFYFSLTEKPEKEIYFLNKTKKEIFNLSQNIRNTFLIKDNLIFKAYFYKNNVLQLTSPTYNFKVIKDTPPNVKITYPAKNLEFTDNNFNLSFLAEDNYKVKEIYLVYQQGKNKHIILVTSPNTQKYFGEINLNLANLNLNFNATLDYYLVAKDNNPFRLGQGKSKVYHLFVPSKVLYEKKKLTQIQNLENNIANLLQEQKLLQQQYQTLAEQMNKESKITPEFKNQISNLVNNQEQLWNKVEQIQPKLNSLQNAAKKIQNPNLLNKILEMQKILQDIVSPELKKAMQELQKGLAELNLKNINKNLLLNSLKNKDLLSNLEQGLSLLKKIRQEEQLNNLQKNLKQILKEQKTLFDKTLKQEEKKGNLAYKQHNLTKKLENLTSQFKSLNKEFKNKYFKDISHNYLNQKNENLAKKSTQSLIENNFKLATATQQNLINNLEQTNNELTKLQKQIKNNFQKQIKKQVADILEKGLYISAKQESLTNKIKSLINVPQDDLTKEQKPKLEELIYTQNTLAEQTAILTTELKNLSNKSLFFSPTLYLKVNEITSSMLQIKKTLASYEIVPAESLSQNTLANINLFLKDMLLKEKEIAKLTQTKMYLNYLNDLAKLAKLQEQLHSKTKGLLQQLGKGDENSILSQLSQIAIQQQAISLAIENLISKMQKEGMGNNNIYNILGNASNQGKEITRELQNKKLNEGTLQKQQRIKQKLLEAQLALKNQGEKEIREAEIGKTYKTISPPEIKFKIIKQENLGDKNNQPKEYLKDYEQESINYEKLLQQY